MKLKRRRNFPYYLVWGRCALSGRFKGYNSAKKKRLLPTDRYKQKVKSMTKNRGISLFREGVYGFLDKQEFTHWGTLTTPYTLTVPSARRAFYRFVKQLESQKLHRISFQASEPFDCKDGCHMHYVVDFNGQLRLDISDFNKVRNAWAIASARPNSRIHIATIDRKILRGDKVGAIAYCSKYITKDMSDWEIYTPEILANIQDDPTELWQKQKTERRREKVRNILRCLVEDKPFTYQGIKYSGIGKIDVSVMMDAIEDMRIKHFTPYASDEDEQEIRKSLNFY